MRDARRRVRSRKVVSYLTGKRDLKEIIAFSFPPDSSQAIGHFMEPGGQRKWFGFGFSSLNQIPVVGGAGPGKGRGAEGSSHGVAQL